MKGKALELYILPGILIVLLFLPHILYFNNNYIDYEPLYVEAASRISEFRTNADLSEYFSRVGNPVFTSLILAGSYMILWESPVISRLTIFFISVFFSLFLYFYMKKKEAVVISFISSLLVIVNPFFIVYSQYIDSDIPFMVFSSAALLLLLYANSIKEGITSSIILGLSLATKYVTLVLLPVAFIYSSIKSRILEKFSKKRLLTLLQFNIWYFVLALLISVPIILISLRFQETILNPSLQTIHNFNISLYIPRILAYLLWLGLFVGPSFLFFVINLWQEIGKVKLIGLLIGLAILTYVVSLFYPITSLHTLDNTFGEMNLSWIESFVPSHYLSWTLFFILLIGEFVITSLGFEAFHRKENKVFRLFYWITVPILLMSLTRVANRYLLVLLVPLSIYTTFTMVKLCSGRTRLILIVVLVVHILIFIAVGFYSNYYLQQKGLVG